MTTLERTAMLAHARSPRLARLERRALDVVERWLSRSRRPYVAFSGGKDSTVLLHLVRRARPGVVAIYGHDEYEWPGTQELLASYGNVIQVCGPVRHADWFVSWYDRTTTAMPADAVWVDSVPGDDGSVATYARAHGFDGAAIGLRSLEASYRAAHIRSAAKRSGEGPLIFATTKGVWQCYPLADWDDRDVWGYVLRHSIPYHPAYDRMAEVGIPLKSRRIGPFAPAGAEVPTLTNLRRCYPEAFTRFASRYPQALNT